ncbi:unnamed protein product [Rangifer tarandus platyrhynchus]|uniref:Uncharacterized protein n=1 Tax=Rangifer tarandus platyrhynchus TaxID=3082113 RepID=A0ABN8YWA2_RANTA|nr:unnamed protein product [Rangifer tarandus platyrhynchus]
MPNELEQLERRGRGAQRAPPPPRHGPPRPPPRGRYVGGGRDRRTRRGLREPCPDPRPPPGGQSLPAGTFLGLKLPLSLTSGRGAPESPSPPSPTSPPLASIHDCRSPNQTGRLLVNTGEGAARRADLNPPGSGLLSRTPPLPWLTRAHLGHTRHALTHRHLCLLAHVSTAPFLEPRAHAGDLPGLLTGSRELPVLPSSLVPHSAISLCHTCFWVCTPSLRLPKAGPQGPPCSVRGAATA